MPQSSRQLVAIMFTDIVGYTALMGKDSAKALELVRKSKEIQKPLVEKHNGQWLKEMGDGALAKFPTALDAVNCALEIQRGSRADFDGKLRIGIHSGDITIENDDVYGDGVNVASRLESIADPGGIYISDSIEKAIRGQSPVQAKLLGELRLKNVDYDVKTYAVQGVGLPVPDIQDEKELSGHFWAEVRRRGLVRAGATYIVLALLAVLMLPYAESVVDLPQWSATGLLAILIVGFPIAMYFAWNYELSPEGFVRTSSQQSWQNPYKGSQKKPLTSNAIIAGMVLIIVGMYLYPRFFSGDRIQETRVIDKSIAVLPFANDSPDPDNEYFCNGMMDEIITHLQKIGDLDVKSRTSVERYRNPDRDIRAIAEELDVAYLIEGSVRKAGDNLRITAQLIDAESGGHLWAETYDGKYTTEIFDFQSSIAKQVASSLQVVIAPKEEESMNQLPTRDMAAYDLQIKGWYEIMEYWRTLDRTHLETAHRLFDRALEIDPEYLQAIALKGRAYFAAGNYHTALSYADRVLAIDPKYSRAYTLRGECYRFMGEMDLAKENYLKAISLPPKDDFWLWAHVALGQVYLGFEHDVIKALPYVRKGLEMDYEHLANVNIVLANAYLHIGDYARAKYYLRQALDMEISCQAIGTYQWMMLAQGNLQQIVDFADSVCQDSECVETCNEGIFEVSMLRGDFEQANESYKKWQYANPEIGYFGHMKYEVGYVWYQLGKKQEAERVFAEQIQKLRSQLEQRPEQSSIGLARIYAFQGNREQAFEYLAQFAFGRSWHDFILIDPFFESLRDDPEFKAIVRQAQEEKAAIRAKVREMEERGELHL